MISLSTCLKKQSSMIGNDCQNLGKKTGGSFFGKKVLISSDKEGWKCIELNFIQLFLRKVFGFYQSTQLFTVTKAYNQEVKSQCFKPRVNPEVVNKFDVQIHKIWSKAYQKPFPKKVWNTLEIRNIISRLKVEFNKDNVTDIRRAAQDFADNLPDFYQERSINKIQATQKQLSDVISDVDDSIDKLVAVKKLTYEVLMGVYRKNRKASKLRERIYHVIDNRA